MAFWEKSFPFQNCLEKSIYNCVKIISKRLPKNAEKCKNFRSHLANFFAKFNIFSENEWSEKMQMPSKISRFVFAKLRKQKFRLNIFAKTSRKKSAKIAATINCSKKLVEFSAPIAQYFKICHIYNCSSFTLINVW